MGSSCTRFSVSAACRELTYYVHLDCRRDDVPEIAAENVTLVGETRRRTDRPFGVNFSSILVGRLISARTRRSCRDPEGIRITRSV